MRSLQFSVAAVLMFTIILTPAFSPFSFAYDDGLNDEFDRLVKMRKTNDIPPAVREYVKNLAAPATYLQIDTLETQSSPNEISGRQALEDIEMIRYLFENAYSGRDYWENHGVDFPAMYDKLAEYARGNDSVSVAKIEEIMCQSLAEISDGHLSIQGIRQYSFLKHNDAYFADVIVEKKGEEYLVVETNEEKIPVGARFADNPKLLFKTLSSPARQQFLIGKLSRRYIQKLNVRFDYGVVELPLHTCRINKWADPLKIFSTENINGIDVLKVASFGDFYNELTQYSEYGKKLRDKPCFILDLRFNPGGSSFYSQKFFENLNTVAHWFRTYDAELNSPPVAQSWASENIETVPPFLRELILNYRKLVEKYRKNPMRQWHIYCGDKVQQKGDYKGISVIISNRVISSAGESTIAYSKSVPGNVIIGENSAGIGTFGDLRTYMLKNSKIKFRLADKFFIAHEFKEGSGYMPDYWLDSSDPVREAVSWLNDPEKYQFKIQPRPAVHDIDFEEFDNGVPKFMNRTIGSSIGIGDKSNVISQDSHVFQEGKKSLKIFADSSAVNFYCIGNSIPDGLKKISVSFSVRGENLRREGNQFGDCYIGFTYKNSNGNYISRVNSYGGTFGWKTETINLDVKNEEASEIEFSIFQGISGTMWIDDVKFQIEK